MKTMAIKLIGGYLLLLSMIAAVAFYSVSESRKSLQESIGQNTVFLASQTLSNMNMVVFNWIDRFAQRAIGETFVKAAVEANAKFAALPSGGNYLDGLDREWKASVGGGTSAYFKRIADAPLSGSLKTLYILNYEKLGDAKPVSQIVVTDLHGAVLAAMGTLSGFRYDRDPLWRKAVSGGTTVGPAELDAESRRMVLPIAVAIVDTDGQAVGVMISKVFFDTVVVDVLKENSKFKGTRTTILTEGGSVVYSTTPFAFGDDVSSGAAFKGMTGTSGSLRSDSGGLASLVSYARSVPYLGFAGLSWILSFDNDVAEILTPSFELQNRIILLAATLFLAGAIASLMISRSIILPVKELQVAANGIAKGDLTCFIKTRGNDELGMLSKSFREMQLALQGISAFAERIASGNLTMKTVKRSDADTLGIALDAMFASLRKQNGEILAMANTLTEAAREISLSASQFAASSSETAAAVNQTTATIEEVKQTAHLSSQKATQMADTARKTEDVAQAGKDSVDETKDVMSRIGEQINLVAESIMRLNEQGMSIGEITTTVSELADQSNLLSVNAAIEAAKAGEQGKGFTVVAQEIKSLAEQSKRATVQVRTILAEVQKATGSAVMAAEQGIKAVEAGIRQAGEGKKVIESLALTVADAALGASLIAATSEEQLVGMDQVAIAMENIQAASVQGVSGIRQLEIEAKNLHDVGRKLKELMELIRM